jgi:hypothetical protein
VTSKGQPTGAARDIIDLIGKTDEPVQVFCLHDSDAAGTLIYQSLQEETRTRPRRNVEIVNLGLDPWEAVGLAEEGTFEIEDVDYNGKRQGVADYINPIWAEWLQSHRVELNAFTTLQFIEWLDAKMEAFAGKVIPPASVLAEHLNDQVEQQVRESIRQRILAEAKFDDQVAEAMEALADRLAEAAADLPDQVTDEMEDDPQQRWTDVVDACAQSIAQEAEH